MSGNECYMEDAERKICVIWKKQKEKPVDARLH